MLCYYFIILFNTIIAYYGQNQTVESEKEENPQPDATTLAFCWHVTSLYILSI